MRSYYRGWMLGALALGPALAAAAPKPGERLSFVACPIVRDTRSVPCWLSEYAGETYYLTIQSDVSAAVQPPMLGHRVLVEGVVSDAPRICGGVVLAPVRLSVMPERDGNCNTLLPADDRYTIDFNPRPPGPSAGRLAFAPDRAAPVSPSQRPEGPQTIELYFDFDKPRYNMLASIEEYVSWGFFDFRMKGEGFEHGYQSVPVDWSINSPRKRAFFERLREMTGVGEKK